MIDENDRLLLIVVRHMLALLLLRCAPHDDARQTLRAGAIQLLGAIEDALGVERTFAPRRERRARRKRVL